MSVSSELAASRCRVEDVLRRLENVENDWSLVGGCQPGASQAGGCPPQQPQQQNQLLNQQQQQQQFSNSDTGQLEFPSARQDNDASLTNPESQVSFPRLVIYKSASRYI